MNMTDEKEKDDEKEHEGSRRVPYWPVDPVLLYLFHKMLTAEEIRKAAEEGKREHEEAMKRLREKQKKEPE
jgi:NH3-dependent NAD+ synthetase